MNKPVATVPVATLLSAVGGFRGIVDSTLPTTAFVIAVTVSSLRTAVAVAVAAGVTLLAVRLVRREPVQQTVSGLVGVGFAAAIALVLHRGSGFFLPGLLSNIAYTVMAVGSVVVGRPIVGYVAAMTDARFVAWRDSRQLRRAASRATLLWAFIFGARVAVQGPLYLADRTGWLGTARLAMGWPLWGVAVAGSVWLLRRAATRDGVWDRAAASESTTADGAADQEAPSTLPS